MRKQPVSVISGLCAAPMHARACALMPMQVRSAMFYTTTANITATGTSMACPVVSGIAALYLQANPAAPPDEARLPL